MSDALIFVSQYEADVYAEKVGRPRKPFVIVRNGLRPEEFDPVATAPDARDFLFIGEVRALKGPDVFIEALAALGAEGRPATAWMVGQGPERAAMEALAAAKGLGTRLAFRDPMPARQAFALARTVVIPSRAESMPYIVLEAIAAGKPLITTRVGGIPEIFGPESGRLVPPGDAAALTAAMREHLASEKAAASVAEGLREQIRTAFSLDTMAAAIDRVYRSVTIARN
jgi:glycosyltransferase involved in cell wall biosynthesis